jgi:hypothetical protein
VAATPFSIVRKIVSLVILAVLLLTLVLILKESPAPNVVTSPAAGASAEQKLDAAAQAANSGRPVQVQLNSTELNSYLAQNLQLAGSGSSGSAAATPSSANAQPDAAGANAPAIAGVDPQTVEQAETSVEDVKIDLDGDLVKTYVVFDFHGKNLSLEIDGHLYTQDGYIRFDPVDGKIGSFPLPKSALQQAVRRMMDSPENREKLRLPAEISNIEVDGSQVVVSYR